MFVYSQASGSFCNVAGNSCDILHDRPNDVFAPHSHVDDNNWWPGVYEAYVTV